MPVAKKKTAAPAPSIEVLSPEEPVEVALETHSQELIRLIETDVKLVKTPRLVEFFVKAKPVLERLSGILEIIKGELKVSRRLDGRSSGQQNQHREFTFGDKGIRIEEKKNWPLNHERMLKLLEEKKLVDDGTNMQISAGAEELQRFLKKYRKEVKAMGLSLEVEYLIDEKKVKALVDLKKITMQEFESCIDKNPPTYSVKLIE